MRRFVLALVATVGFATVSVAMEYSTGLLDDGRCGYKRQCPVAVLATGDIVRDEIDRLQAFFKSKPNLREPSYFIINSEGGSIRGGVMLGVALRELRWHTVAGQLRGGQIAPGRCASACVFTLMGGRSRHVPPGSQIVVHAPAAYNDDGTQFTRLAGDGGRKVRDVLSKYARLMGISTELIALTLSIPHETERELSRAEIRRFKLSTVD